MSNYWPIVMWLSSTKRDKHGEVLIYLPSWSHYSDGYKHFAHDTYDMALWHAQRFIRVFPDLSNPNDVMPSFIPAVICQSHTPVIKPDKPVLTIHVRRITLWDAPDHNGKLLKGVTQE